MFNFLKLLWGRAWLQLNENKLTKIQTKLIKTDTENEIQPEGKT